MELPIVFPADEIAEQVIGESYNVLISPPMTPMWHVLDSGWELRAALDVLQYTLDASSPTFYSSPVDGGWASQGMFTSPNSSSQQTPLSIPQNSNQPALKHYKSDLPSGFCHSCGRKTRKIRVAVCGRFLRSVCRKVICEKCLERNPKWAHRAPLGTEPIPEWECPHCRTMCGSKAQCAVYGKSNQKRHVGIMKRRSSAVRSSNA